MRYGLYALLLLTSWGAVGCRRDEHDSAQRTDASAHRVAPARAPHPSAASAVGPATGKQRSAKAGGVARAVVPKEWIAPFDMAEAGPAPSGANWGRCALHFKPEGRPKLDVMRLGLMCGPSNGMRRVPLASQDRDAGAGTMDIGFSAQPGDCYRVLVVGGPRAGLIDARLLDSHGRPLARQSGRRRWTMLGLDGPVCMDQGGRYRATVRAEHGPIAVQLWLLR